MLDDLFIVLIRGYSSGIPDAKSKETVLANPWMDMLD